MSTRKNTMVELVEELGKLPQTAEIKHMVKEARAGEFHDFKNKKYTCGKVESYTRLMGLGHVELANKIKNGEFDEEADYEDRKALREMAIKGGFSKKALKEILGLEEEN